MNATTCCEITSPPDPSCESSVFRVSAVTAAVQHIKRMKGGAQSHLMRCEDDHFYVVKFRNNPQHERVLANEFLATKLGEQLGLPMPAAAIVYVQQRLIDNAAELTIMLGSQTLQCEPGLHFGSRYVMDPRRGQVLDYLPLEMITHQVRNLDRFAGILVLDKWTCNVDGRQAAFSRKSQERKYSATFIDQGYCFNAEQWTFTDFSLRGVYPRNEVYAAVSGWNSFEPWLSRVENFDDSVIWSIAEQMPPAWYGHAWNDLEDLIRRLIERKPLVRELIRMFRDSPRRPFPKWQDAS